VCFFRAEDGIRGFHVTGVQTCALPISAAPRSGASPGWHGWCAPAFFHGARIVSRLFKWSLLALLSLCLLLVVGLAVLLGSAGGSRWLLGQVPGLQVQGFEGRLAGDWQARHLEWAQGEQRVTLVAPQLDWSLRCLFQLRLCIKRLAVEEVQLVFPPDEEAPPA